MPAAKGQWSVHIIGGLSLQGLSPGPVLGFSVNPRTVQTRQTWPRPTMIMLLNNCNKLMLYVHTQGTTLISVYVHAQIHVQMVHKWSTCTCDKIITFSFTARLLHDKPPGWLSQYPQQTCSDWPAKNTKIAQMASSMLDIHLSNEENPELYWW